MPFWQKIYIPKKCKHKIFLAVRRTFFFMYYMLSNSVPWCFCLTTKNESISATSFLQSEKKVLNIDFLISTDCFVAVTRFEVFPIILKRTNKKAVEENWPRLSCARLASLELPPVDAPRSLSSLHTTSPLCTPTHESSTHPQGYFCTICSFDILLEQAVSFQNFNWNSVLISMESVGFHFSISSLKNARLCLLMLFWLIILSRKKDSNERSSYSVQIFYS